MSFGARAQNYADVGSAFWASQFINTLDEAGFGIQCSSSPRKFCPQRPLLRASMAVWLTKASKGVSYRPPASLGTRFTDLPASSWAARWAEDIDRAGVDTGCGGQNQFCPFAKMTRADLARNIARAGYSANFQPPLATGHFVDVPPNHPAAADIEQLRRDGVVWGCRGRLDLFCPDVIVSRAVAAKWITHRFNLDTDPNQTTYTEVSPPRTNENISNPHRGFMVWGSGSYQQNANDAGSFTYVPSDVFSTGQSIYHVYVSWRDVEPQDQNFDWNKLERQRLLPIMRNDPNATFVLRIVADYPAGDRQGSSALYTGGSNNRDFPGFLTGLGIRTEGYGPAYGRGVCAQVSGGSGITPDWNDPQMINQMQQLVEAFGARFDGDPRITAIQTGTLGLWGEGHQWSCPHNITVGSAAKVAIRNAYDQAFTKTPIQTRYPGRDEATGVEFGFYEDYFPTFTVECARYPEFPGDSCNDGGDWNLYYGFTYLTPESTDNWKYNPLSGESPLGQQQSFWINKTDAITRALREYHFSFLGPAGPHNAWFDGNGVIQGVNADVINQMPASERSNPVPFMSQKLAAIQSDLGYRLHAQKAKWATRIRRSGPFELSVSMANSGTAPIYNKNYALEVSLVDAQQQTRWRATWAFPLSNVVPGNSALTQTRSFTPSGLTAGRYSVRLGIVSQISGRLDGLLGNTQRSRITLNSGPRDNSGRVILGNVTVE